MSASERATGAVRYFAYGSNMLTRRLRATDRVPHARPLTTGTLPGWRLRYNKIGRDTSGKFNVEETGVAANSVWGVLYEVPLRQKAALDRVESLGVGYDEVEVTVATAIGNLTARTYVAILTDDALRPFLWYRDIAIAGAVEHALPGAYIQQLRTIVTIDDPDAERHQANLQLLYS